MQLHRLITRMMGGAAFAKWAERVSVLVGTIGAQHPCFEHDESGTRTRTMTATPQAGRVLDAAVDVLPAMAYVMRGLRTIFMYKRKCCGARVLRGSRNRTMVVAALADRRVRAGTARALRGPAGRPLRAAATTHRTIETPRFASAYSVRSGRSSSRQTPSHRCSKV